MQRSLQTFALLFTLLSFAAVTHAKDDGHDKDRAYIVKAYADTDKAAVSKDVDGYIKYEADSFQLMHQYGDMQTENKAQQRHWAAYFNGQASNITAHTTVESIVFRKRRTIVHTVFDYSCMSSVGPQPQHIITQGATRDLWKKFGGQWRKSKSYTYNAHTTINGKPVK